MFLRMPGSSALCRQPGQKRCAPDFRAAGRTEAPSYGGIPEEELHIWRSVMCRMFGNLVKAEEEASKTNKNIKEEEEKDE